MNRRTFLFVTMLGALLTLMTIPVMAQNRELIAEIPFDFTVCTQQLPAGKYKVRPMTSATTNLLLVRSEDNRFVEIACTHDIRGSKPVSSGKLIFNRYGSQYFLAELWFPGEMTGHEMYKSDEEEAVIKELAPKLKQEKVTIRVTEAKPN
jgi:hypothetical protein